MYIPLTVQIIVSFLPINYNNAINAEQFKLKITCRFNVLSYNFVDNQKKKKYISRIRAF